MQRLRSVIGNHPYVEALRDGRVSSPWVSLEFETVEGALRNAMTLMARNAEFDLCEMSPTSYLLARQSGVPLIALPVFPYRQFPLDQIVVREDSGIGDPSSLAGKRIGTRTWAQPTGLWIREILSAHYDCDLLDSRWTFVNEDPFPGIRRPESSADQRGATLTSLLTDGQVDAVIGSAEVPPGCRPLFSNPVGESRAWFEQTGLIPVNHLIAMRAEHRDPQLMTEICRMFEVAKRAALAVPGAGGPTVSHLRQVTGLDDPLPYGWRPNSAVCSTLFEAMRQQGMCDKRVDAADVIEPIDFA
ncbi:MAG: ABC transporter substrate-binding protein [Streptosporangiaceae bacterium]|jgi:4,5-dihydroxyphthalate decarboxylase